MNKQLLSSYVVTIIIFNFFYSLERKKCVFTQKESLLVVNIYKNRHVSGCHGRKQWGISSFFIHLKQNILCLTFPILALITLEKFLELPIYTCIVRTHKYNYIICMTILDSRHCTGPDSKIIFLGFFLYTRHTRSFDLIFFSSV